MTDWEDIHPDFTDKLQKEWEERGFDYYDCKGYIDKGLKPGEADFANYLYYQGYYFYGSGSLTGWSDKKITKKIKELREEYTLWKNLGIASEFAFQWQNIGFTYEQIKEWLKVGLKPDEYEFAAYLRDRDYISQQAPNLDQLREEFHAWQKKLLAQKYLDCCYPKTKRRTIKILDIKDKNLAGSLDLSDFVNLEILDCWGNKLTDLKLDNCQQLRMLNCNDNQLTTLDLTNSSKLEGLKCGNNYLEHLVLSPFQIEQLTYLYAENNNFLSQDCSIFRKCTNLRELKIGNHDQTKIKQGIYNCFTGSLEPLQNLGKLEYLDISNTDIDSGLEYLPKSVKVFSCEADKRKKAKARVIQEDWEYFNRDLKKYRDFISEPDNNQKALEQWLEENYPQKGECRRETTDEGWDGSGCWNNQGKKREEITKLDISQQNLVGRLRLKGFTSLKKLNCSGNKLTSFNLGDCQNLVELKCDNNPNLSQDLKVLVYLKELKYLDVSNCPFEGSLKPLESLNKLEQLNIGNTSLKEGLEYLPESCKKIYCNSNYPHQSTKIMEELDKSRCLVEEKESLKSTSKKYYSLDKWRTDKQNSITASTIPLERLFVIRSNLKQFLNKWGKTDEGEVNNELSELQSPEQYSKFRYLGGVKWIARATAVTGGILALTDQATIGGSLAAASPFIDAIASQIEENYYTKREEKWKEFLNDADMFLDNYHELLGIIKKLGVGSDLGKVNKALKDLNEKANEFLEIYDENQNKEVDISELIEKRTELAQELAKNKKASKLWGLIDSIKQLEDKVVDYKKKGSLIEEEVFRETEKNNKTKELESVKSEVSQQWLAVNMESEQASIISLTSSRAGLLDKSHKEEIEMKNFEQETKIVQLPIYGVSGSSKN